MMTFYQLFHRLKNNSQPFREVILTQFFKEKNGNCLLDKKTLMIFLAKFFDAVFYEFIFFLA